jgi:hypothetical protein
MQQPSERTLGMPHELKYTNQVGALQSLFQINFSVIKSRLCGPEDIIACPALRRFALSKNRDPRPPLFCPHINAIPFFPSEQIFAWQEIKQGYLI